MIRSAETVDKRSSRYLSGTFISFDSLSATALTFFACAPTVISSATGSPTSG